MTSDLEKKLQDLAQEYIVDVMCDSWTKKILELFEAELAQAVKEERKEMGEELKGKLLEQCGAKDGMVNVLEVVNHLWGFENLVALIAAVTTIKEEK